MPRIRSKLAPPRPARLVLWALLAAGSGSACQLLSGVGDRTVVDDGPASGGQAGSGGAAGGDGGSGGVASGGAASGGSGATAGAGGSLLQNGAPCVADEECSSESCSVFGVCCDDKCNWDCLSCLAVHNLIADGLCLPMPRETDPLQQCGTTGTCRGDEWGCGAYDGEACTFHTDCLNDNCSFSNVCEP
jgi:hypothetical protein